MSRNWKEREGALLSQSQRGYTGLAAFEGPDPPSDLSTHPLDCQLHTTLSRQP